MIINVIHFIMISTRKLYKVPYNPPFYNSLPDANKAIILLDRGHPKIALKVGLKPLSQSCFSFSKFLLKATHGTDHCVHGSKCWPQIRFWVNRMQVLT